MYKDFTYIKGLKGVGPTKGGPTIGLNPLTGYPGDISVADVEYILSNTKNVEQVVDKYPVEGNFLSERG